MKSKSILRGAVMVGLIAFGISASAEASAATLTLTPASGTHSVGSVVSVQVMLNTNGAPIEGVDIHYLTYNPKILSVVDSDTAASGVQITPGNLMPNTVLNAVDTAKGLVDFSQITSGGTSFSNTVNQALATITFQVIGNGASPLKIDHALGNTRDSNVASNGVDILTSSSGATLVLGTGKGTGGYIFTRNLRQGMTGEDVRELQKFLNAKGFSVSSSGAGSPGQETTYFGLLTRRALIRYQDQYRAEILVPAGITRGTGFFGAITRKQVNGY